jgi:hypothetical protein
MMFFPQAVSDARAALAAEARVHATLRRVIHDRCMKRAPPGGACDDEVMRSWQNGNRTTRLMP